MKTSITIRLPSDLVMKLQTVLRSSSCPEQLLVLSSSIIRQSFPPSVHSLCSDLSQDSRTFSYVASVVLSQVSHRLFMFSLCSVHDVHLTNDLIFCRLEIKKMWSSFATICWKVLSLGCLTGWYLNMHFPFSLKWLLLIQRFSQMVKSITFVKYNTV